MNRHTGFRRLFATAGPILGLLLVLGIIALHDDVRPRFFTGGNFKTIFIQTAIVAVGALGMTLVIVSGGIDLSAGSMVALASVVAAKLLTLGWATPGAILVTLGLGAMVGASTGAVIAGFRMMPFIVTLGTMGILRGVAKWISGMQTINNPENAALGKLLEPVRHDHFFPLPPGVWITLGLGVAVNLSIRCTIFGRHIFAVGANEAAARLSGVRVAPTKVWVYTVAGVLFAFGGLLQNSRLTQGDPTAASGLELDMIAAAVIGGASLSGGVGNVLGSMVGAFTMAVLRSGADQIGWQNYLQEIIIGGVIILAVGLDQWRQARPKK